MPPPISLPSLRRAMQEALMRNMSQQALNDGSIPRGGLRDALSFAPDPDDVRPMHEMPDELVEGLHPSFMPSRPHRNYLSDAAPLEIARTPNTGFYDAATYDDPIHARLLSEPEDAFYGWRPLPWTRLINRTNLEDAEHEAIKKLIRASMARIFDEPSGGAYRRTTHREGLAALAREMERLRKRHRDE